MKTYTVEEIREAFSFGEQKNDFLAMIDTLREKMGAAEAGNLMTAIFKSLDTATASSGQAAADVAAMGLCDRILYIVREAFIAGQVDGYQLAMDMQQSILDSLTQ